MIFKDKSIWLEKIDTKSSKILGIDFGIKKVGLAIHYCNLNTSIPNKVLNEHSIHKPIIFFDENFTSKLADRLLKQTNLKRKKRNKLDDSISAQIILDDFFKI
jgi:RNase H-fold protein (predicted Holliday junction resolvase)